jgi:hypothetical protein
LFFFPKPHTIPVHHSMLEVCNTCHLHHLCLVLGNSLSMATRIW